MVGNDLERLGKFHGHFLVHLNSPYDHYEHSSCDWRWLDIIFIKVVLYLAESEFLELAGDLLQSCVDLSLVAEDAVLSIEVDKCCSVIHHALVVLLKKVIG